MKRILTIALALLLAVGSFSALAEDKTTISYYAYWVHQAEEDNYVEKFVEDNLGIEIELKKVDHTDADAVALMLANDMPDCGWIQKSPTYMMEQELIRPIPVSAVREYCSALAEYMDENPMLWALCANPDNSDELLFLPDLYVTYGELYLYCFFLRYDWVEKLGIDLGVNIEQVTDKLYVADKGLSVDVFTDVLRQFVFGDPDGNGIDDTEGYVKDYTQLLSGFGLTSGNMEYDGHITEWYTHPNTKELLAWLRDAYAEGLIYKEIFTVGWGQDWELITNGVAGMHGASSTNSLNAWANNRPPRTLLDSNIEGMKLLVFPGVADEDGHTYETLNVTPTGGERFFINADVDDEKMIEILKFYNWTNWNDNDEVVATLYTAEKGVDWVWNEDQTVPQKLNSVTNGEKGSLIFIRNTQLGKFWEWITLEPDFEAISEYCYKGNGGIWNADKIYPYKVDIDNSTNAAKISNEYSTDWTNTRNAYFMAVILGEKNLEEDWDAYIAELNNLEYDAYLEELEKAPTVDELIEQYSK